jgi:phospholipid/cholesterol/gamma-HCH transport system substrate-binding protein
MLRISVRIQLALFVLITLAGVSYVSAKYVGLFHGVFGDNSCTVRADFPDSGGIFTNAEVTYRGVTIGKVGQIHLTDTGVRVDLNIDDCKNPRIPANTAAAVSDRSVIGEQYVNLIPADDNAPYLAGGSVIAQGRTTIPIAAQTLLRNLDLLANSVDIPALQTTVSELGRAFSNRGQALGQLLDSTNDLLGAAQANLPQTLALIRSSSTVLGTQLDEQGPLKSFAHSLNLLAQQLTASDPDIRNLLDNGPADLAVVRGFVQDNRTDLGVTLANLADVGQLLVRHLDGLEQILELYPALAAGGRTSLGADGVGALGVIVNYNDPPDCGDPSKGQQGYQGTDRRPPGDLSPKAPNVGAHCTAPASSGVNVRGSANVPGGDPISESGGGVAYPRVTTASTVRVGNTSGKAALLGDRSWIGVLTTALN